VVGIGPPAAAWQGEDSGLITAADSTATPGAARASASGTNNKTNASVAASAIASANASATAKQQRLLQAQQQYMNRTAGGTSTTVAANAAGGPYRVNKAAPVSGSGSGMDVPNVINNVSVKPVAASATKMRIHQVNKVAPMAAAAATTTAGGGNSSLSRNNNDEMV
jgi:hypothetical protein